MASTSSHQNNDNTLNKQNNNGKGNDDKKGPGRPRSLTCSAIVGDSPKKADTRALYELLELLNFLALRDALERADEEPQFNKSVTRKRDGDDDGGADQHDNKSVRV